VSTDAADAVPRPEGRFDVDSTSPVALDTPAPPVAPSVRRSRRRRRPSGAAPPLPRSIGTSGKGWLVAMAVVVVWVVAAGASSRVERLTDRADAFILRSIARVRVDWLSAVARAVSRFGTGWSLTVVAVGLLVAIVVFRRWRHLFTFLLAFVVLGLVGQVLSALFNRPRPYDVTIIGRWTSFSMPAKSVAVVAVLGVGICYALVPPGRPRKTAKVVAMVLTATFAAAQLYLGVDHPSDVVVSIAFAVAILLNAFRFFTPNEVFPVTYRRGKTAHLDVTGRRGEAIRRAVQDQLGLTVLDAAPIGLAGSGGSTPLRIRVAGDPDTYLFGKLYAMNHVRADRWYKLGRTILYGRLEDEMPFQSVRRLVQYEDYALRLLQDVGVPTAAPVGIVELTPEREYLLLTGFVDGSQEIGDAPVDDQIIDEGLTLVRRLWDVGVAHRDIKPANLLVQDGHLVVIDVAFLQVRPSPWREAVDLANMMLVLAVRTDAERVYRRALQFFTAEEIAEAFAATRGVASPTQLRTVMKQDGRDLMAQFRALAPPRRPISLQRWSVRRIALAIMVAGVALIGVTATFSQFTPINDPVPGTPSCGTGDVMVLMAQTVPSATSLPCLTSVPAGWGVAGVHMARGEARFSIASDDQGGHQVAEATLLPAEACTVADAVEVPSEKTDMRRFESPAQDPPNLRTTRYYLFDGGCVRYHFAFHGDTNPALMSAANSALAFQPRVALVDEVRSHTGLRLCGADAPPCPGGS
jgi:membrane-associated phospholipid phosphatase/tRNA A-37 threonylcarbamoyl transferase component Bud32